MKCDRGNVNDQNRNSAINIMLCFLSTSCYVSYHKKPCEKSYQQFVDNLRQTDLQMGLTFLELKSDDEALEGSFAL
jgi:hypothetical protein